MEIEYKITFEEFKNIIKTLEKENIDYFVYGGFAFDGVNNEKKNHEDLDLIFFMKDKIEVVNLFKRMGYIAYLHGRKHDYRKENIRIDVLFMNDLGDCYEILGNIKKDKISKEAFTIKNKVKIKDFEFTIMPFEWFSLYYDSHHLETKKMKLNEFIKKIRPLCKELPILSQDKVDKPENMKKIEIML